MREALDFIGYNDGYRFFTGRDPYTGREIPWWQQAESGALTVATFVPFFDALKPEFGLGKAALEAGEVAGRDIARSEANAFGKAFSCLHSFSPDTPVLTKLGLTPIASLAVGQDVLAYNEQKGQNEYQPIQQVFINQDPQITFLQVDQELVTTTPEHPFYVKAQSGNQARPKPIGHEDLNEHWVGAGHLKVGDKIQKADGGFGVVRYVNTVTQTRTMYNLEVKDAHTFFVGTQGWLVHNCEPKAAIKLLEDRFGTDSTHGLRRHGAGTTLEQQQYRARTGYTPDGVQGPLRDSTRFLDNADLLSAYERAQSMYRPGIRTVDVPFSRVVGEGYYSGGRAYNTSTTVRVQFDSSGLRA